MSTSYEEEERRRLVSKTETEPEPQNDEKLEPSLAPHPADTRAAREHAAWKHAYRLDPMPPSPLVPFCFQGGKWKVGKTLAEMIEAHRAPGQTYIEPFVGGANVIWRISGARIGSDLHELLINFWLAVVEDIWKPDPIAPTDAEYDNFKARYEHVRDFSGLSRKEQAQVAWIGYAASHDGAWFNGIRRETPTTTTLDMQRPGVAGVKFWHCDYTAYKRRKGCLFYCDPPYIGHTGYAAVGGEFDHAKFWDWAARMARHNNTMLVSEATLPPTQYIEEVEPYMAGRHGDRQEYLILVKASRG